MAELYPKVEIHLTPGAGLRRSSDAKARTAAGTVRTENGLEASFFEPTPSPTDPHHPCASEIPTPERARVPRRSRHWKAVGHLTKDKKKRTLQPFYSPGILTLCLKCDREQRRKCERLKTCNPKIGLRSPNGFNKRELGERARPAPTTVDGAPLTIALPVLVAARTLKRYAKAARPLNFSDAMVLAAAETSQELLAAVGNPDFLEIAAAPVDRLVAIAALLRTPRPIPSLPVTLLRTRSVRASPSARPACASPFSPSAGARCRRVGRRRRQRRRPGSASRRAGRLGPAGRGRRRRFRVPAAAPPRGDGRLLSDQGSGLTYFGVRCREVWGGCGVGCVSNYADVAQKTQTQNKLENSEQNTRRV